MNSLFGIDFDNLPEDTFECFTTKEIIAAKRKLSTNLVDLLPLTSLTNLQRRALYSQYSTFYKEGTSFFNDDSICDKNKIIHTINTASGVMAERLKEAITLKIKYIYFGTFCRKFLGYYYVSDDFLISKYNEKLLAEQKAIKINFDRKKDLQDLYEIFKSKNINLTKFNDYFKAVECKNTLRKNY